MVYFKRRGGFMKSQNFRQGFVDTSRSTLFLFFRLQVELTTLYKEYFQKTDTGTHSFLLIQLRMNYHVVITVSLVLLVFCLNTVTLKIVTRHLRIIILTFPYSFGFSLYFSVHILKCFLIYKYIY